MPELVQETFTMFQPHDAAGVPTAADPDGAPAHAWRHMLQLAAHFEQFIGQLRGTLGLSSNEMNALLMLWQGGACSMTELSERIALSRPAVTTLIDRLEANGYAIRAHDERDRRQVLVAITDRFERELDEHAHAYRQRLFNHAAASSETWETFVEHAQQVGRIASMSARELRDKARVPGRAAGAAAAAATPAPIPSSPGQAPAVVRRPVP